MTIRRPGSKFCDHLDYRLDRKPVNVPYLPVCEYAIK